jgi:hypothetical protein
VVQNTKILSKEQFFVLKNASFTYRHPSDWKDQIDSSNAEKLLSQGMRFLEYIPDLY